MGRLSRHLGLVFLATVLVVAAFSTGIAFLFFLVYLLAAILVGSWFVARRGLTGIRADYRVLNPRAHVGEVLEAIYRLENHDRWGKPWIELSNDSSLPVPLPGRVVGIQPYGARQWLAKARPGPGPDGLRRPLWLARPVKPKASAYRATTTP